jgi:5-methylcytosine-specific restriction protein A
MAGNWQGHHREMPPNWARTTVPRILARDHGICHVCKKPGATDVDHVVPHHLGGTDEDSNLAAIHRRPCHARKTAAEANARRWAVRTRRPPERHPGIA